MHSYIELHDRGTIPPLTPAEAHGIVAHAMSTPPQCRTDYPADLMGKYVLSSGNVVTLCGHLIWIDETFGVEFVMDDICASDLPELRIINDTILQRIWLSAWAISAGDEEAA